MHFPERKRISSLDAVRTRYMYNYNLQDFYKQIYVHIQQYSTERERRRKRCDVLPPAFMSLLANCRLSSSRAFFSRLASKSRDYTLIFNCGDSSQNVVFRPIQDLLPPLLLMQTLEAPCDREGVRSLLVFHFHHRGMMRN